MRFLVALSEKFWQDFIPSQKKRHMATFHDLKIYKPV